jgi:dephospho-CoA kinase
VLIGLTGGIGAGKSTVAARLAELGATVIDADQVAREVVGPGTPGLAAVLEAFGPGIRLPDGALDRSALGRLVFSDDAARARLNSIVHPLIARRTAELVAAVPAAGVVVHDVPLLVENGLAGNYRLVIVVHAEADARVRRLVADRGMGQDDAWSRVRAQASDEQRRAVAGVWIDNSGTPAATRDQVDACWWDQIIPLLDHRDRTTRPREDGAHDASR